jgi:Xaa-Pro aminopeptidase
MSAPGVETHCSVAYVLNLRGHDIPFNPVFLSYLMITRDKAILFIDPAKLNDDVNDYLKLVGVETREYNDVWTYLRKREWGEGKVSFSSRSCFARSKCSPVLPRSSSPLKHHTRLPSC